MSCNTGIKGGHASVVRTWFPPAATFALVVVLDRSGEGIHLHLLIRPEPTSLQKRWCEFPLGQEQVIRVSHADPLQVKLTVREPVKRQLYECAK